MLELSSLSLSFSVGALIWNCVQSLRGGTGVTEFAAQQKGALDRICFAEQGNSSPEKMGYGARVVAQRLKQPPVALASQIRAAVPGPDALLPVQLTANVLGKENVSSLVGLCIHVGDPNGVPGSWFCPGPAHDHYVHLGSEPANGRFLSVSVCFFL